MRSILRLTPLAGVLLAAAACSDGATGPETSGLTRSEAAQLAALIGATSSDHLGIPAAAQSGAASLSASAAPRDFSGSTTVDAPCALGGDVRLDIDFALSVDEETQSGSLETEARMVHRDCGVRVEEGSLTLDGSPELTLGAEFAWSGGAQTSPLRVTHGGSVDWARDSGEAGTCEVSLVAVTDLVARRRTVEGTVCGFGVDQEIDWSA